MSKDTKEARAGADEGDPVVRNEFGGVFVDEEELRAAFDFFDVNKKGTLVLIFFFFPLSCIMWEGQINVHAVYIRMCVCETCK